MPCVNPLIAQAGKDWRTWTLWEGGIKLGSFLGAVIDFIIIAFVLFLIIRGITRLQRKVEAPAPVAPPPDPAKEREERLIQALERLNRFLERK